MNIISIQVAMAQSHFGNIFIHLAAIVVAGHVIWHLKGIQRELRRMVGVKV